MKSSVIIGLVIGILAIGSISAFILFNPPDVSDDSNNDDGQSHRGSQPGIQGGHH